MCTYNKLSRQELIKEIRKGIFRTIHGELTALAKDIQNSDFSRNTEKQKTDIDDLNDPNKSIESESHHTSDQSKRKNHFIEAHRNLADSKKFTKCRLKYDIKDGSQDSDASNDSSIVLSNLKSLVSSKKSSYKSTGTKQTKLKTKNKFRFVKTHPAYLENVDTIVQDDLYEAIVTTQIKKRKLRTHKKETKYICGVCDYASKSKRLMRQHKMDHKCESFNSEPIVDDDLRINKFIKSMHAMKKQPLSCEICNFSNPKRKVMKFHKKLHKDVYIKREFDLKESNMESIPLSQLNQKHMINDNYACNDDLKVQIGTIPFSCDQCSYECNTMSELTSHKLIHNAYTQFACGKCDFTSVSRHGLIKHKKSHSK